MDYFEALSPADSSEDSVEVRVEAIAAPKRRRNTQEDVPLKKRARAKEAAPFRPWSPEGPLALVRRAPSPPRVPLHPGAATPAAAAERAVRAAAAAFPALAPRRHDRNYKNMTRERRIEANARERTRVHTISAAFDTLRRAVPAYSHNQKLSKLSVLRIACSYIATLASLAGGGGETAECVRAVTKTIQREGKLRKKKDDDD